MIKKGCTALSMQLHTGVDFFLSMQIDDLNDYARTVSDYAEEVSRRGKK